MVTDDKTFAKTFNEHYTNIVERSSGLKPEKMEFDNSLKTSRNILHSIIDRYKNHPSILKIKSEESSKGFRMFFLGYLKGPLSALHYLTASLAISFLSSIKLVCIIVLMITL